MTLISALAGVTLYPADSWACTVCGIGERSRIAYLGTTALLSLVPLVFVGGLCYYLFRRSHEPR